MGKEWGGNGEGMGRGRSVYEQPGTLRSGSEHIVKIKILEHFKIGTSRKENSLKGTVPPDFSPLVFFLQTTSPGPSRQA
jgi:hypothetical protein